MKIYTQDELEKMNFAPVIAPNGVVRARNEEAAKRLGVTLGRDFKVTFVSSSDYASVSGKRDGDGVLESVTYKSSGMDHRISIEGRDGILPLHEFAIVADGFRRK